MATNVRETAIEQRDIGTGAGMVWVDGAGAMYCYDDDARRAS